jgi:hypothetical protein
MLIRFLHLALQLSIGPYQILMLTIHFLDSEDILLALIAQNLILPDQNVDKFVDRFELFNAYDG